MKREKESVYFFFRLVPCPIVALIGFLLLLFAKSSNFSFIGGKIGNTILFQIRTAPTLSAFKKQILL